MSGHKTVINSVTRDSKIALVGLRFHMILFMVSQCTSDIYAVSTQESRDGQRGLAQLKKKTSRKNKNFDKLHSSLTASTISTAVFNLYVIEVWEAMKNIIVLGQLAPLIRSYFWTSRINFPEVLEGSWDLGGPVTEGFLLE